MSELDVKIKLERLTDAQRECLRLVHQHYTSKQMSRVLGVSPHAVDMRLRNALKILDLPSRVDAARLFAEHETRAGGYQPSVYQTPELGGEPAAATLGRVNESRDHATQYSPTGVALPPWTWEELEVLLVQLAQTPTHKLMAQHLIEGLRRSAPFLTPAGLLRELSIITLVLTDPSLPSPSVELMAEA